jgi:hypothetical protein
MVITVEEWTCLQARVYFRKEVLPTCFPWSFFICATLTLNPKPLTAWGCCVFYSFSENINIKQVCGLDLGSAWLYWLIACIHLLLPLAPLPWSSAIQALTCSCFSSLFVDSSRFLSRFCNFFLFYFIPVSYANCARCSKTAHSQFLHF